MKVSRVDTFLIFINGLHFVFISGRVIGILFSFDVCLANVLFLSNSLASYCGKYDKNILNCFSRQRVCFKTK